MDRKTVMSDALVENERDTPAGFYVIKVPRWVWEKIKSGGPLCFVPEDSK